MKRIKWGNLLKAMLFVVASGVVVYDFYYLVIYPFISNKTTTYTWFGLIICILSVSYIHLFIEEVLDYKKGN